LSVLPIGEVLMRRTVLHAQHTHTHKHTHTTHTHTPEEKC